jgi:hypothetical protein
MDIKIKSPFFMVHKDKIMPIFTKNVSYMTLLVLIDSQESKVSGDTKIIEIGQV